jgi:hypothetical protein
VAANESGAAPGLRVLACLKAARDFGLDPVTVADIAGRVRAGAGRFDDLVDALARALTDAGAVRLPPRAP